MFGIVYEHIQLVDDQDKKKKNIGDRDLLDGDLVCVEKIEELIIIHP